MAEKKYAILRIGDGERVFLALRTDFEFNQKLVNKIRNEYPSKVTERDYAVAEIEAFNEIKDQLDYGMAEDPIDIDETQLGDKQYEILMTKLLNGRELDRVLYEYFYLGM